jgi:hypothetical protein
MCSICDEQHDLVEKIGEHKGKVKVKDCWIFSNGNVMAFDASGEQITEVQGFILDIGEKLKLFCDADTEWYLADISTRRLIHADFSWWWEKYGETEITEEVR